MNWDHLDMTDDGILYRARMKAPETLFTVEEEKLFVGWTIYQDLAMQSSTTDKFGEYVCFFVALFSFFLSLSLHLFSSLSVLYFSYLPPFFFLFSFDIILLPFKVCIVLFWKICQLLLY